MLLNWLYLFMKTSSKPITCKGVFFNTTWIAVIMSERWEAEILLTFPPFPRGTLTLAVSWPSLRKIVGWSYRPHTTLLCSWPCLLPRGNSTLKSASYCMLLFKKKKSQICQSIPCITRQLGHIKGESIFSSGGSAVLIFLERKVGSAFWREKRKKGRSKKKAEKKC